MDNIKAAIEELLRRYGVIKDDEIVKLLTFGAVAVQTTVRDWEKMNTVPVHLVLKKEEVELIR